MSARHEPVLVDAVLATLLPSGRPVDRLVDGTLGLGGHTRALLEAGVECALGMDVDPEALRQARETLRPYAERAHIVQASYTNMARQAAALGWAEVGAILLDLGVSSLQLDTAERGFAFRQDGPLDMRFDPAGDRPTAAELINHWDKDELAELFFRYGEERHSRRIASAIVRNRPLDTTARLAEVIEKAVPLRRDKRGSAGKIHPATRVFQALRIAVNDELASVEQALPAALELLRPGGRLAVISFHSLEDRIVKNVFRQASREVVSPPGMVLEEQEPVVRLVNRKPITADEDEIERNPRSRSAKLRVVEKL
jgi:16S rRNA (cytosine1402-N4)-methyltransferase